MTDPQPTHLLQFDGGARHNPGKAAGAACLIRIADRALLFESAVFLECATNNQAEYTGLCIGLERASELGVKAIRVEGDSLLIINQMAGEWKVKHAGLRPYYERAMSLIDSSFAYVEVCHIPREQNKHADRLANEAMDQEMSFHRRLA